MYAWPKFHGSSPYGFRENDLNTKKLTPPPPTTTTTPPPEKQYICLASASQARQKSCLQWTHMTITRCHNTITVTIPICELTAGLPTFIHHEISNSTAIYHAMLSSQSGFQPGFHFTQSFIIILPLPWYDWNAVKRAVKPWIIHHPNSSSFHWLFSFWVNSHRERRQIWKWQSCFPPNCIDTPNLSDIL